MDPTGKVADEAYSKSAGGVSLATGDKLPPWEALPDPIKRAWQCSADAIYDVYRRDEATAAAPR